MIPDITLRPAVLTLSSVGIASTRAESRILLNKVAGPARLRWKVGGRHGYARYMKRVHGDALL